jgi:catechol 2,3-dioxygenase-like lactoylglutathione lyase family enzyme
MRPNARATTTGDLMTDPRPANVPWLTPYLAVRNARAAIDFFKAAFGFALRDVHDEDGAIMHVEMTYHDQLIVMFAPEGAFGSTALAEACERDRAAVVLSVRRRRRRDLAARARCGREVAERAAGPVLGRPLRADRGSRRLPLGTRVRVRP